MAAWQFAVGNALRRAARAPVAALASVEDDLFPLSALGDGLTDSPARWARNAAGLYAADIDLNMLAETSSRQDAPTGWADFLNAITGTPGLPADPPDWGSYAGRNPALRFFRPVCQDVDVMPGETVTVRAGIYLPAASTATAVRLRVVDAWTGRSYDGTTNAWDDADVAVAEQTATDAWLDFAETIPADVTRRERTRYRVILEDDAGSFDSGSYAYASAQAVAGCPSIVPAVNFCAVVGHGISRDAVVTLTERGGSGTPITLVPEVPSFFATAAAQHHQVWRLRVELPSGSAAWHERPYIGEVWAGTLTDLTWCPAFPFDITVDDPGQVLIAGGYGRTYAVSDAARERSKLKLQFKVHGDAGYEQIRRALSGATRHGIDPLMLVPVAAMEGAGTIFHGHLGDEVAYSRKNNARREFTLTLDETPFPRVA
jgi:hypothetical protein